MTTTTDIPRHLHNKIFSLSNSVTCPNFSLYRPSLAYIGRVRLASAKFVLYHLSRIGRIRDSQVIFRGYRVAFFILPAISRLKVPYWLRVNPISLKRSRRMIQSTLGRYGTLSLDMQAL